MCENPASLGQSGARLVGQKSVSAGSRRGVGLGRQRADHAEIEEIALVLVHGQHLISLGHGAVEGEQWRDLGNVLDR